MGEHPHQRSLKREASTTNARRALISLAVGETFGPVITTPLDFWRPWRGRTCTYQPLRGWRTPGSPVFRRFHLRL